MSSQEETGISGTSGTDKDIQNASMLVNDQSVEDYLRRHPEFFQDKPSLLTDLRIPHHAGNAVSLIERQIQALRDSNESRQAQLDALIQIARDNDALNSRLHLLTLELMESENLEAMLAIISKRLRKDFNADLVELRLLSEPLTEASTALPEEVSDIDAFCEQFQRLLGSGKPYCGRLKNEQLKVLFAERGEAIGSTAILPLGNDGNIGLLAIGSFERTRFSAGADTDFLVRMAEIISTALSKHLKLTDT